MDSGSPFLSTRTHILLLLGEIWNHSFFYYTFFSFFLFTSVSRRKGRGVYLTCQNKFLVQSQHQFILQGKGHDFPPPVEWNGDEGCFKVYYVYYNLPIKSSSNLNVMYKHVVVMQYCDLRQYPRVLFRYTN